MIKKGRGDSHDIDDDIGEDAGDGADIGDYEDIGAGGGNSSNLQSSASCSRS